MAENEFVIENGVLKKYTGAGGDVVIPDEVKTIDNDAFKGCTSLTSATIPDGVTKIVYDAFKGCTSLTSVTIPASVTSIGVSSFEGCSALTSVTIPAANVRIGSMAFGRCTALTELNIPSGGARIGGQDKYGKLIVRNGAFHNCLALRKVRIHESTIADPGAFDNCPRALGAFKYFTTTSEKTDAAFIWLGGDRDETDDVEALTAFIKKNRKVLLSAIAKSKEDDARLFGAIMEIAPAKIPLDQLDTIIQEASGKAQLTAALLEYKRKTYTVASQDKLAEFKTEKALGLTKMTVSDYKKLFKWEDVEGGISILQYISKDAEVVIPETIGSKRVVAISERAFESLSHVTSVYIPDSVASIGRCAFYRCTNLSSVRLSQTLVTIESSTFANCEALNSIEIPKSVIGVIHPTAFSGCTQLTDFRIDKANPGYECIDGVVYTNEKKAVAFALSSCAGTVRIIDGVTDIGSYAFSPCKNVTEIVLPDSLAEIYPFAFDGCTGLTNVRIPDGVTSIGHAAFSECSSLTSVTISNNVTSIGFGTFSGCINLTSVTIPDSVTSINDYAFLGCKGLTIHGKTGSFAEQYAKQNEIPFKAI